MSIFSQIGSWFKKPADSPATRGEGAKKAPRSWEEILEEMRELARAGVTEGFDDEGTIVERCVDCLSDEADADEGTLRRSAEELTREAFAEHRAAQAGWPTVTDCDRLDAAFEELNRSGVVARQNFSCCQNCGNSEIMDEVKAATAAGLKPIGYTYYHMQDTESAARGSGIFLAYAGETDAVAVANQVVETLKRHGLQVEWDGDLGKRILVPMDWKRRR